CRGGGLSRRLGSSVQTYVEQFTGVSVTSGSVPSLPSVSKLRSQAAEVRSEVERLDCDRDTFLDRTGRTLHAVDPDGPVASAVADVVSANVLDVLAASPGGPDDRPRVAMSPGDNLAATMADLP